MAYYIDAEKVSLDDLRKRIEDTDLVPSRASLLDGINSKFKTLEQQGITTLALLRSELKNSKHLEALSKNTAIEKEYWVLLRREIEGYFPGPFALKDFDWLPKEEIVKLEANGIRDTAALYHAVGSDTSENELVKKFGVDAGVLKNLVRLADLTRVQWASPTVARMLVALDYDSASKLAAADAENLCEALVGVNEGDRFFKGKIGLRDIKRLVRAASYV